MPVYLGSTSISDVKLGSTQVKNIYLGSLPVWSSFVYRDPETTPFTSSGTYTPPSWWRNGIDYLDIIIVSAGGAGGAYSFFTPGRGGAAGHWVTGTRQTLTSGSLTITLGAPGAAVYGGAGGSASPTRIYDGGTLVGQVTGGAGGGAGGGNGSNWNGGSPGNQTYEGETYVGGTESTPSNDGRVPGGGGAGAATSSVNAGNGARSQVWIVARQNTAVQ